MNTKEDYHKNVDCIFFLWKDQNTTDDDKMTTNNKTDVDDNITLNNKKSLGEIIFDDLTTEFLEIPNQPVALVQYVLAMLSNSLVEINAARDALVYLSDGGRITDDSFEVGLCLCRSNGCPWLCWSTHGRENRSTTPR